MLFITLFFESICFPTIVALGMRGLGKHSKRGSGWIVAGVSGGAVVPPALGAAADAKDTATAMAIPMAFFVLAWSYALAVNFVPAYREPIDMMKDSTLAVETAPKDEESASGGEHDIQEKVQLDKGVIMHAERTETEERDEIRKM